MSRRKPNQRQTAAALVCLAVAVLVSLVAPNQVVGLQQAEHEVASAAAAAHVVGLSASPNSETSSIIESAGSDDLIAAESSQAPSADVQAEHKAFTSGQVLRQVSLEANRATYCCVT